MEETHDRRRDIDAKQAIVGKILAETGCDTAILLVPAHLAWFSGGLNLRGLFAESERPGVTTNGKMRWLICSNADTQRLFDEELDGLGFMLKEWNWHTGRAQLLADLVQGKKVASDRPFPGLPLISDRLRSETRPLYASDRVRYIELAQLVSHALEATARTLKPGETEEEIAGQLAHRAFHRGIDVHAISVAADDRNRKFRRSGYTDATVQFSCTLQLTGVRDGLHATFGRSVTFELDAESAATDAACKLAGAYFALSKPGRTFGEAVDTGFRLLEGTAFEHEHRLNSPGYGTGWFPADELRKMNHDEPFVLHQPLVWQARLGSAAVVETVIVGPDGAEQIAEPADWPFKRIVVGGRAYDIPDRLVRTE